MINQPCPVSWNTVDTQPKLMYFVFWVWENNWLTQWMEWYNWNFVAGTQFKNYEIWRALQRGNIYIQRLSDKFIWSANSILSDKLTYIFFLLHRLPLCAISKSLLRYEPMLPVDMQKCRFWIFRNAVHLIKANVLELSTLELIETRREKLVDDAKSLLLVCWKWNISQQSCS